MSGGMWGLGVGDRRQVELPKAPHEHVLEQGALDGVQIGHEIPSYSTLAETPHYGPAAGGEGTPPFTSLVDPVTAHELASSIWTLGEHARVIAQQARQAACDWHALDRVVLSSTVQVDGYQLKGNPVLVAGRAPCRRLTVHNPTQAPVYLGESAGTALQAPVATVPPLSTLVMPWNATDVELACDTIFVPAGSGLELATILVSRSDRELDELDVYRHANTVPAITALDVAAGATTPLAAAATYTSLAKPGAPGYQLGARAYVFTDQAGNAFLDGWFAGAWRQVATVAIVANTFVALSNTGSAPWYRLRIVNGATPQTVLEAGLMAAQ